MSNDTTQQQQKFTDAQLSELAQEFVLAMMASASTQHIRPMDWWERARTALELSASSGANFREMTTRFAQKIHAHTLTKATTDRLNCLSSIEAPEIFAQFRRVVARESTYIVAFAQQKRAEEREEADVARAEKKPAEERAAMAIEEARALRVDRDIWKNKAKEEQANAAALLRKLEDK